VAVALKDVSPARLPDFPSAVCISTSRTSQIPLHRSVLGHNAITNTTSFTGNPPYSILPYSSAARVVSRRHGGRCRLPFAHRRVTAAVMSLPAKAPVKKLSR
jgi:hypothetical protein